MSQCYRFLLTLSLASAVFSSCSRPAYLFRATLPAYLGSDQGPPPVAAPEAEAAPAGPVRLGVAPPRPVAVRAAGQRLPGMPPPPPAPRTSWPAKKITRLLTSAQARPRNAAQAAGTPPGLEGLGSAIATVALVLFLFLTAALVLVHVFIWLLKYLIISINKPRPAKTSRSER